MKKGINTWSFPGDWHLEKKLALAADAGFEGFEVDFTEDGLITSHSTSSDIAKVRKLVSDSGLKLSALASGLYWKTNPVGNSAALRVKADFLIRRHLECASDLEVDTILVVPGVVGTDFMPDDDPVRYDVALDRAREFVEKALPVAEQLGVTVALENVWNKFLLSPVELRGFIDSFASPHVASYFDVGNALANGYPEHWIQILGHRIARVHLKDYRRKVTSVDGFVELLSGDVNWPEVTGALRGVGYKGWLTAELIPPVPFYRFAPDTLIYNTSRAMDRILSM